MPAFPLLVAESFEVDGLIGPTLDNSESVGRLRLERASLATLGVFGAGVRSLSEVASFEDDPVSSFDAPCSVSQTICRQLLEPSFRPTRDEQVHPQHSCFRVPI